MDGYRKAAEEGDVEAQFELGWCYFHGIVISKDKTMGIKWIRKAAENGSKSAICELGTCYLEGDGIAQDKMEAVKWLLKASEKGSTSSDYYLRKLSGR